MFDKLDLTADQKRDVAQILKSHREEIGKVAAGVSETKLAVKNAIHADEYSEATIREAAQNAGNQREQMAVLMAQILVEVKSVLTPEQKEVLLKMTEKRGGKSARFVESKLSALDKWIAEHGE
jgi:Spy/CpxP family protein refolding chaperone